jgi:hypothetical protein
MGFIVRTNARRGRCHRFPTQPLAAKEVRFSESARQSDQAEFSLKLSSGRDLP